MELEKKLDGSPTAQMVAEYVELSIRNRQCREELTSFNNRGKFLNEHPILKTEDLHKQMTELLLSNPDEFMNRLTNVKQNIARYKSYINNKKKQKDLQNNKAHLEHWQNKQDVMISILKDRIYE
ncbi:MAG: hypothetical protein IKK23_04885 [Bacteroidales bacterium]|nr:hypothetical protein [Bacteroidales bacterium]MBR4094720.1 hypothetical protein [Bacteroidales bacterium]